MVLGFGLQIGHFAPVEVYGLAKCDLLAQALRFQALAQPVALLVVAMPVVRFDHQQLLGAVVAVDLIGVWLLVIAPLSAGKLRRLAKNSI